MSGDEQSGAAMGADSDDKGVGERERHGTDRQSDRTIKTLHVDSTREKPTRTVG